MATLNCGVAGSGPLWRPSVPTARQGAAGSDGFCLRDGSRCRLLSLMGAVRQPLYVIRQRVLLEKVGMSKFMRLLILATGCLILGGCGAEGERSDDRLATTVFDTVTAIGALEGADWEVFGVIRGIAVSGQGDIAVLDLQTRSVSVFSVDGEFLASLTARGEGPGELSQPWTLHWMGDDRLIVTDRGNARISEFVLDGSDLQFAGSMRMEFPMGHFCTIEERVFAAAYRENGTIHSFEWGVDEHNSFGTVPEVASLDGLDSGSRAIAIREWAVGRLQCDETRNRVLEVGTLNGHARLFAGDGTTIWQQRLEDVHLMEPVVENGAFSFRADETTGAHVAQSAVVWDSEHVLVQHQLRFPDDEGAEDRARLASRLIHLETGVEEERSYALPRLMTRSGDRFVSFRNEPYPQLLILEKVFE